MKSTFVEILGSSTSDVVLYHLKVSDPKMNVEDFVESLEEMFASAAFELEKLILEKLYSKAGRTFQEKEGYKFIDYVNEAKTLMALK